MDNGILKAQFPEKLDILFQPHRYKVIYGGRGGSRSWSCARALLIKAATEPIRVLCAREVQRSIKDSVHKLLSDQISLLNLGAYFEILESTIRGKAGSEFNFAGLSTQTIESIKSMEGVDFVWAEEAHTITKRSWDILIPTIRKENSEIWITFNPSLESDETFQRFVANPPPDTAAVKLDYKDNPWFPEVLEKERLYCKANDPEGYRNIWEGECKPAVEGAIYYNEVQKAANENRICNVPYDPMLKVQVIFDLGWNDAMAISLVQKHTSELRIIEYIEDSHKTLDYYSALLKAKMYNWGKVWLPHDGYHKDFKTGMSTEQILKKFGWNVAKIEEIAQIGIESGIMQVRMLFNRLYFDREKTGLAKKIEGSSQGHHRLVECIKRYRRHINLKTQEPGAPLHDWSSHGCDNLRYICVNADSFTNEDEKPKMVYHQGYQPIDEVINY